MTFCLKEKKDSAVHECVTIVVYKDYCIVGDGTCFTKGREKMRAIL